MIRLTRVPAEMWNRQKKEVDKNAREHLLAGFFLRVKGEGMVRRK